LITREIGRVYLHVRALALPTEYRDTPDFWREKPDWRAAN
jgi:hypothetical protein